MAPVLACCSLYWLLEELQSMLESAQDVEKISCDCAIMQGPRPARLCDHLHPGLLV